MLNRELSLTFTSESDIIKLQRYELYDNRYRIFGNIAMFYKKRFFLIVDFKENIKRIWGTTTKKKIVISAAALAVVAAGVSQPELS